MASLRVCSHSAHVVLSNFFDLSTTAMAIVVNKLIVTLASAQAVPLSVRVHKESRWVATVVGPANVVAALIGFAILPARPYSVHARPSRCVPIVATQTLLGKYDTSLIVFFPSLTGGYRSAAQSLADGYRSTAQSLVGGHRSTTQSLVGYRSAAQESGTMSKRDQSRQSDDAGEIVDQDNHCDSVEGVC